MTESKGFVSGGYSQLREQYEPGIRKDVEAAFERALKDAGWF